MSNYSRPSRRYKVSSSKRKPMHDGWRKTKEPDGTIKDSNSFWTLNFLLFFLLLLTGGVVWLQYYLDTVMTVKDIPVNID